MTQTATQNISSFLYRHLEQILRDFPPSRKPLDLFLSQYFRAHRSLGASDRRIIGNILYGMVRWKSLIDHFAPQDPITFYENLNWEKALSDPSIPLHARLGLPEFLFNRFSSHFGFDKTVELGKILNETAPTTIRANLLKTTREKLVDLLNQKFPVSPCTASSTAIRIHKREPLFSLPEFKEGLFEMQDEGSQIVAHLVKAGPTDCVLDYCSGSGGKTLAFAPSMEGKGQIYLTDIRTSALMEARKRLKRAGIQNAQCLPQGHNQLKKLIGKCDWVLIDVPCSGTGTLKRNPDQKWLITSSLIEKFTATQREIAKEAIRYVKPGGHLVYVTCSLLPEENSYQIEHFIKTLPVSLAQEPLLLLPESQGMDGFFCAILKKHPF